jgi:hypothetical protein
VYSVGNLRRGSPSPEWNRDFKHLNLRLQWNHIQEALLNCLSSPVVIPRVVLRPWAFHRTDLDYL